MAKANEARTTAQVVNIAGEAPQVLTSPDEAMRTMIRQQVMARMQTQAPDPEQVKELKDSLNLAAKNLEAAKAVYEDAKKAYSEAKKAYEEATQFEEAVNREVEKILAMIRGEKPARHIGNGNGRLTRHVNSGDWEYIVDGNPYTGQQRSFSDVVWYVFQSKNREFNGAKVRQLIREQCGFDVFSPEHFDRGSLTATIMGKEFTIRLRKKATEATEASNEVVSAEAQA